MNLSSETVLLVPRKTRERERKVEDVLAAASQIFARKGFHRSSMEEIARAADYATGALYRYFPSKEMLFGELVERKIERLLAFLKDRVRDTTCPEEALLAMVIGQVEFARQDMTLLQIFFEERLETTLSKEGWQRIEAQHHRLIDWVASGIKNGQAKGVFREGDPRLYAIAMQGMLHGLYRDWFGSHRSEQQSRDDGLFVTELFLMGVLKPAASAA